MTLYRINKPLSKGNQILTSGYSSFTWLSEQGREKLIQRGVISELQTPPLFELPGWKLRSKKVEVFNIKTCADFLETQNEELVKIFKAKVETIERYKKEIEDFLFVPVIEKHG